MVENLVGDNIATVGTVGVLCLLILKEVFKFIKSRNSNGVLTDQAIVDIIARFNHLAHQSNDVHGWLGKEDADGVKLYYNRKSLATSIDKLCESVDKHSQIGDRILIKCVDIEKTVDRNDRKLVDIANTLDK